MIRVVLPAHLKTLAHVSGEVQLDVPADRTVTRALVLDALEARYPVLFAHGSGSSRFSPRNRMVADRLTRAGFATVLTDLLTGDEERVDSRTAELRFDIPMLARRLIGVVDWLAVRPELGRLPLGLFGASTGAAAALMAAADRADEVRAVVSRGGRPDLAGPRLAQVRAPTLLLVGGLDRQVIILNEAAADSLTCPHELRVIPGASHLFTEGGTLEQVADAAEGWFSRHLPAGTVSGAPPAADEPD